MTLIKCLECKEKINTSDINEKNPLVLCECGNLEVFVVEADKIAKYSHYVGIKYKMSKPEYEDLPREKSKVEEKNIRKSSIGFT